jgi:hypothetical protein
LIFGFRWEEVRVKGSTSPYSQNYDQSPTDDYGSTKIAAWKIQSDTIEFTISSQQVERPKLSRMQVMCLPHRALRRIIDVAGSQFIRRPTGIRCTWSKLRKLFASDRHKRDRVIFRFPPCWIRRGKPARKRFIWAATTTGAYHSVSIVDKGIRLILDSYIYSSAHIAG